MRVHPVAIGVGLVVLLAMLMGSSKTAPAAPSGDGTDWSKVHLMYCVGDAPTNTDVLADNQPDPVPLLQELKATGAMQGASPDWYKLFKAQVEDPAGRVRLTDVQPYHVQLCTLMLSGKLQRADKAGRLYKRVLDDIAKNVKDAEDLAITNQVISGVAAFIPVIGGAIKLAVGTGLQEGQKGAIQNAQNEAQALQALQEIGTSLGIESPEGRMWLANTGHFYPDPLLVHGTEVWTVGLSSMGGYYRRDSDGSAAFPSAAVRYVTVTENGQTFDKYTVQPGYTFVPCGGGTKMRLFAMHQFGWLLAWLSPLLGSDDPDVAKRIAIRSPVIRFFDLLRAKTFPVMPDGTGKQSGYYFYVNPKYGAVLGSQFPPTAEDKRFKVGLTTFDYDGTDTSKGTINMHAMQTPDPPLGYKGSQVIPTDLYALGVPAPSSGETYTNTVTPTQAGAGTISPPLPPATTTLLAKLTTTGRLR